MSATVATPPAAAPVLMTAEEFCGRYPNHRAELVRGRVVELPMPWFRHGKVCGTITRLLGNWAEDRDCGHVGSNDSFVQTGATPDTVRGPDVIYFSYERLPKGEVPDGLLKVSPDLVVEVKSPSDAWTTVFAKVFEYLRVGVRAVVVLDPETKTASVYLNEFKQFTYEADQELTVPEVLPGFSARVGRLFE